MESCVIERPLFDDHRYVDGFGNESIMAYVPPFVAGCALSARAATKTPSDTVGDWFFASEANGLLEGVDFAPVRMGDFFVDRYLSSAADASGHSRGTPHSPQPYVSRAGVAPMVDQTIDVFKRQLALRFAAGEFSDGRAGSAGSGGLLPDVYWNQIWIYARLSGCAFHGNTDSGVCFLARDETGQPDPTTPPGTLTGSGPATWDEPLSDFTGNRAEFTDGLRLVDGVIYSSGRAIDPPLCAKSYPYTCTGLVIGGVAPYASVAAYRTEPELREHGIGVRGCPGGKGGMSGQGLFYTLEGERIADRGSGWTLREIAPGKLSLGKTPIGFGDRVGGRAIWVPK
jgi:hypothetical protein